MSGSASRPSAKGPTGNQVVSTIQDQDVLLGRGIRVNSRPANALFRQLCYARAVEYGNTDRVEDKERIAEEIRAAVENLGGRFLRAISRSGQPDTYEIVDKCRVQKKIKQAIRDQRALILQEHMPSPEQKPQPQQPLAVDLGAMLSRLPSDPSTALLGAAQVPQQNLGLGSWADSALSRRLGLPSHSMTQQQANAQSDSRLLLIREIERRDRLLDELQRSQQSRQAARLLSTHPPQSSADRIRSVLLGPSSDQSHSVRNSINELILLQQQQRHQSSAARLLSQGVASLRPDVAQPSSSDAIQAVLDRLQQSRRVNELDRLSRSLSSQLWRANPESIAPSAVEARAIARLDRTRREEEDPDYKDQT